MLVANFGIEMPVCLSGFGALNYRRDGENRRGLCFISEARNTKIMIRAVPEHRDAVDLHGEDDGPFAVLDMLESWMIHATDHWFIAPSTWRKIPEPRQTAICARIMELSALADRSPFSVLDDARRQIIALAESQLAAGGLSEENRRRLECVLQEQRVDRRAKRTPLAG